MSAEVVDVWPEGKMPGEGASEPEAEVPRNDGFTRITNISNPTLTLFPAAAENGKPAPAMIICPGGGYRYVVMDKEGTHVAEWLNSVGITALLLKYRTPNNREGALQDIQRAVSLVRAKADAWQIDPKKVGVVGFSAGGNVAAKASTKFDDRSYPAIDEVDQQSCRPDFAILVYPAYLLDKENGGVSSDLNLEAKIPPTLIVHSEDDQRHVPGSRVYQGALEKAGIDHAFKLYKTGGHGYGLNSTGEAKIWPEDAAAWLKEIGVR
ncbi:MAG: alpha/beta hydrolase [Verrucomicrobiota bacterium]